MNDRISVHCWRALGLGTVLLALTFMPQHASAQCAVSYGDISADDTNVYAWNGVTDYYNQSQCYPGTFDFVHGYFTSVEVFSPSARSTSGENSSSAYGGGGYAEAWGILGIDGEAGIFSFSSTALIYCSAVLGVIFQAGAAAAWLFRRE